MPIGVGYGQQAAAPYARIRGRGRDKVTGLQPPRQRAPVPISEPSQARYPAPRCSFDTPCPCPSSAARGCPSASSTSFCCPRAEPWLGVGSWLGLGLGSWLGLGLETRTGSWRVVVRVRIRDMDRLGLGLQLGLGTWTGSWLGLRIEQWHPHYYSPARSSSTDAPEGRGIRRTGARVMLS